MAQTYEPGSTADRDRVRLYMGDTDVTGTVLFVDEEYDDFLATEGSVNKAVALAAETMANKTARNIDFSADGSSFKASQEHTAWVKMARKWRGIGEGANVVAPTKIDGYSQTVDSDDVFDTDC